MPGQVNASALSFPQLRADFWGTFATTEKDVDGRLGKIFNLGVGSVNAQEAYAYGQRAPVGRFWAEGLAIPTDQFQTNLFFQRNWKFGIGVEISKVALSDAKLPVMDRINQAAASFAMLKERHFYWLVSGGTTVDAIQMQPLLPLAPDGVGLTSKLDGSGNNRFQVANGNTVASQGVGSPQAIINNFYGALSQIASFRDLQNQPIWNPADLMREVTLLYNSANNQNFDSAINQNFIVAASGNAAPSNVLKDRGQIKSIDPIANPRLTGNGWFVASTGNAQFRAPFWQEREAPSEMVADTGNSDISREWDVLKLYVKSRGAIGLALPYAWCGVS